MTVPLLDDGEAGFDAGEDPILDCFRLELPLIPSAAQAILLHAPLLLNGCPLPFDPLLPLVDHLRERLPLLLSFLLGDAYRLDRLLNGGLVGFVLIADLRLSCLDQFLELGNLEFKKLDRVLSGDLLSLKGSGELESGLELAGKSFKAVHDILWDVRS